MIYYASRTGNTKYICGKLNGIDCVDISDVEDVKNEFVIFTYTDGLGGVPSKVQSFMDKFGHLCKGVICTGNTNFGHDVFCKAADKLSEQFNIPILHRIELRGFEKDYQLIIDKYNRIMEGEAI